MADNKRKKTGGDGITTAFVILEVFLFFILMAGIIVPSFKTTLAVVGQDNVTVSTLLDIGNVFPEVLNVTIDGGAASVDLSPNSTVDVVVFVVARDYNGDSDITNVTAEFFDNSASFYGDSDDNNYHYTNSSCVIDTGYGDAYEISANCTFSLQYYANNATWNASVRVIDTLGIEGSGSNIITVNTLLALGLPDSINYGQVNATEVSDEQVANVTNFGNVIANLSLSGYAVSEGDGYAMNCSLGNVQNISIDYEKYNLSSSVVGDLNLTQFENNYTNLTSSPVVRTFNLNQRQNDFTNDAVNATYWRIYVPIGVAGSCTGNIIFGAVQDTGS